MAQLGQLMDQFYRVYGMKGMQTEELELINKMIAIKTSSISILPDLLENEEQTDEEVYLYKYYIAKSLRLLKDIKSCLLSGDYEKIKVILIELDQNRRNAHQDFG